MFRKKSNLWWVVLLAVISLSSACEQTTEANKLVDEAHAIKKKNSEIDSQAVNLINELMGSNMTKAEDVNAYKTANKAKFDELMGLHGQLEKNSNEAAAKYEEVSKLKLNEKFKEYCSLMVQEQKKSAEVYKMKAAFVKAFLAENDTKKADQLVADFNKKNPEMSKEADALVEKAEQIVKDNPNVFESK